MTPDQKQLALQMLRKFEQAVPMTRQAENAAVTMAAILQELVDAKEPEPVGEAVDFNGWRIVRWKGKESSFPLGTKFYTAPPAPSVPVLTVECEPDYWSGGHYHEGTKPHIDPTAVWKLPIGTELYTSPPANNQSEQHLEMVNAPALSDERIFKLFLEKAVDKGTAGIYDFARAIEREILG